MTTFQFPSKPTVEELAQIRGILQQNSDTIAALKSQVRDLTKSRDYYDERYSNALAVVDTLRAEVRDLTGERDEERDRGNSWQKTAWKYEDDIKGLRNNVERLDVAVKLLLEWMPICSVGSTGHSRRVAVEKALEAL